MSTAPLLHAALDALPSELAVVDLDGTIVAVNAAWMRFARENGYVGEDYGVGASYLAQCQADGGAAAMHDGLHDVLAGRRAAFRHEYSCHAPGVERWFAAVVTPFEMDGRRYCTVVHEDITDTRRAQEEIRRIADGRSSVLEGILRGAPLPETVEGVARFVSWSERDGASDPWPVHVSVGDVATTPPPPPEVAAAMHLAIAEGEPCGAGRVQAWPIATAAGVVGAIALVLPGPGPVPAWRAGAVALATRLLALSLEHARMSERLTWVALHDPGTGLPNRRLLADRLALAIARPDATAALLRVRLGLSAVRRGLSGSTVEGLVAVAGQRASLIAGSAGLVARIAEDELAILLPEASDHDAARAAVRVLEALGAPASHDGITLMLGVNVGVALYPRDGGDAEALQLASAAALGRAEARGAGVFELAGAARDPGIRGRLQMEAALREAIPRGELELHYQPKVDFHGRLVGFEALLRWRSAELGWVSPGVFVPVAEECGLIRAIGAWVFEEAARQVKAWADAGLPPTRVSVNVSPIQFADPGFSKMISTALARTGADPCSLELEVTESAIMRDADEAAGLLGPLRARGLTVSVDDFGTGHSSLAWLQRLPLDTLKIDRAFVSALSVPDRARGAKAIVMAVIGLAHDLGLEVVAEGVETPEQAKLLADAGCDLAQGYLFHRPLPREAARELLARQGTSGGRTITRAG